MLRDCGPEFILDSFDIYYSVLHHESAVTTDIVYKAYEDLHRGLFTSCSKDQLVYHPVIL